MNRSLCFLSLLLSFTVSVAHAETLAVHGSTVFTAALMDKNKSSIEKEANLTLNVQGSTAGEGLEDIVTGKADVAMITGQLQGLVDRINAKKPGLVDASVLKTFDMGKTRVAFVVHPSNPVQSLTREQIVSILKGQVTNWKEVGGSDMRIILITGVSATGLRSAVEKDLLNGDMITDKAKTLLNTSLIRAVVEKSQTAIGIIVTDMLTPAIKEVKVDGVKEISMALVTKGEPSDAEMRLVHTLEKYKKN